MTGRKPRCKSIFDEVRVARAPNRSRLSSSVGSLCKTAGYVHNHERMCRTKNHRDNIAALLGVAERAFR